MSSNRKSAAPARRARALERTRQDIVEAAGRVFGERGYHAATMQAIAAEAGFTAASLYTYFRSKEEIYEALMEGMRRTMLATLDEPMPAGLTLAQRLELLLQRQLTLVSLRRDVIRVAFQVSPVHQQDEAHEQFVEGLTAFLEHDADALRCPPAEAARYFFGMVRASVEPWIVSGAEISAGREAGRIVDFFLHGVAAPPR